MIRRILRLSAAERGLLARAGATLLVARLGLWLLYYERIRRLLAAPQSSRISRWDPHQVAWAVQAASHLVPASTCLVRAMALERLLRADGHPARLRLGVTRGADAPLAAHAWVESDGAVLMAEPGFEALEPVPR